MSVDRQWVRKTEKTRSVTAVTIVPRVYPPFMRALVKSSGNAPKRTEAIAGCTRTAARYSLKSSKKKRERHEPRRAHVLLLNGCAGESLRRR